MTPEEIRAMEFPATRALMGNRQRFEIQREIAAQLAEQNELAREDLQFRREVHAANQESENLRNQILGRSIDGIGKVTDAMSSPPRIPPTVVFPGEVTHLACLIREPDGTHAFATHDGRLVHLEPEEGKNILAILTPTSDAEAKPQ